MDTNDLAMSIDLLPIRKGDGSRNRSIVAEAWRRFRANEAVLDPGKKVGNPDARQVTTGVHSKEAATGGTGEVNLCVDKPAILPGKTVNCERIAVYVEKIPISGD